MEGIKRDAFFSMLKAKVNSKDLAILFPDYGDNNYHYYGRKSKGNT